jgi:IS1 family transposase
MAKTKEIVNELLIEDVVINDIDLRQELKEKEKQILDLKKSNEEITANEHNIRQRLERLQGEFEANKQVVEAKDKQIELMKNDLNKLANLFDEYIVAYQDQVKMLGVFVKNTQTVEKYLATKIEEYNGGSKK